MVRLLIAAQRPSHLSLEEAESWLRRELRSLAGDGVAGIRLTRLAAPSPRSNLACDWLVEIDCASAETATRAASSDACLTLLGDLRLLGMRPAVAMEDGTHEAAR